jgi:site-specific DNA-methyltransferase (cytosine-N4-specific)
MTEDQERHDFRQCKGDPHDHRTARRHPVSAYYADESVTIHHGTALALPLPDASVDLVVTSPPYFGLRSYQDGGEHYSGQIGAEATPAEFVDALIAATAEMVRVLKPSGSIWVNLGDKYAGSTNGTGAHRALSRVGGGQGRTTTGAPTKSLIGIPWRYALRCIDDLGLILRAEVIWSKPNGLPESVTDRVRRSHETWFHFTVRPRYFSAVDEVREPHLSVVTPGRRHEGAAFGAIKNGGGDGSRHTDGNPLGKLPGSVWDIPTQPLRVPDHLGIDHFAAFPMEWPRRIIRGWCPEGGTVLDPFGGTGTTALVAKAHGRKAHHVDLSADYCRLAQWRVTDPAQLERAGQPRKTTRKPCPDCQRRRRDDRDAKRTPALFDIPATEATA